MTSIHRARLAGLVAVALAAASGLVGISSAPSSAAVCRTAGITAVVDFNDGAGGGIATACNKVAGSKKAAAVFGATGFSMTRNPDRSVCKVNSKPVKPDCGRLGSEYWGLWWSDGKSDWKYSQVGVDALTVPRNGSVAWAWQGPSGQRKPGVAPPRIKSAPAPAPNKQPTKAATKAPEKVRTQKSESGSAPAATKVSEPKEPTKTSTATGDKLKAKKAKAKKSAAARASKRAKASASASASSSASESAAAATESDDATPETTSAEKANSTFTPGEEQNGLPVWVPILVVLALAGSAGGTAWWRRRNGAT